MSPQSDDLPSFFGTRMRAYGGLQPAGMKRKRCKIKESAAGP
jgi:hypothetical protein